MNVNLGHQLLIGEALKFAAHQAPNQEAFVYENQRLTFQDLLIRATHIAGWLQGEDIGLDDKVGCLYKNSLSFVELYFGVSLNGSVLVPINFRLAEQEIEYILNQSDVKILFVEEEFLDTIRNITKNLPQIKLVVINGGSVKESSERTYESVFESKSSFKELEKLNDDDAHAIIYTSGTTGKPKGAVLTHKNLYMNGMNKFYHARTETGTKYLIIPPLFHVASLSTLVQNCIGLGTLFIHREFNPVHVLETIQKEKINSMFLVPSMWNFLLQTPNISSYDVSSMTTCAIGGAISPVEVKQEIMRVFSNAQIYEAFGQTEMSPTTTHLYGADSLRKTESVGKTSINVRVRIVDDNMNDVPIGEVGEIIYQGPTTMKEYYKNEKATKEAFQGGWFHSGDLVRMDEEGYIYVVDRKKDMIISGGENIYPKELEEVLYCHPAILEAAVIGVPDPKWGETVKAFVVLKPNKQVTKEEIEDFVKEKIASYKKPRFIEFTDALPRNAAGKVLKTVLRNQEMNMT